MPAWADFDADAYPPYEVCALCHGLFGQSATAKFPHLAGQKPAYLEAQIRAFHAGERRNDGGQMASIVTELDLDDIPVVVEWFSTQDPPKPALLEGDGMLFVDMGCAGCHGAEDRPDVPHLTSQHSGYLAKQMRDYRAGQRSDTPISALHQNLLSETPEAIQSIADYLASVERPQ